MVVKNEGDEINDVKDKVVKKSSNLKLIIIGIVVALLVLVSIWIYFIDNTKSLRNNKNIYNEKCGAIVSLEDTSVTGNIVECYLNEEKSFFVSGVKNVNSSEILLGNCKVTNVINKYIENKYHQITTEHCRDCYIDSATVWFECSEYYTDGPFGCSIIVDSEFNFGKITCN